MATKYYIGNTDMLRRYDDERARLQKRLDNLIEMRADGEITKEMALMYAQDQLSMKKNMF